MGELPQIGPAVGFLLANGTMLGLTAGLSDAEFRSWGWRVPFWAAGLLAAGGLLLRSSLAETPQFEELSASGRRAGAPLTEVVRDHWRLVLLTAGALAVGYAVFYAVSTWALAYGTGRLGLSGPVMLSCVMAAVAVMGAATPFAALLADRWGRRTLCLAGCAGCALWMFPLVALLHTAWPPLMFLGFLGALLAFITMFAVVSAYLPELYEPRVRCTGAAVGYNLAGVLGGALTPLAATALSEGGSGPPWGVAAYLTLVALVGLGCFALLPETLPARAAAEEPVPAGEAWKNGEGRPGRGSRAGRRRVCRVRRRCCPSRFLRRRPRSGRPPARPAAWRRSGW